MECGLSSFTPASDRRIVNSAAIRVLTRLSNGRFQSFSEAAEATLDALEEGVPGTIVLGRLEAEEELFRVIDLRGPAVDDLTRGSTLPLLKLGRSENGSAAPGGSPDVVADGGLDGEFLRSLSIESWLAMPLEMSEGNLVGALCAVADRRGAYEPGHAALLGIAARLLSYEWEGVRNRTDLQRLQNQLNDDRITDSETSLPTRETFVAALDREWHLAKRGNVKSVVVACHVETQAPRGDFNGAMPSLALKDAAAVLAGHARSTDHVGRVGEVSLAAVLVGCQSVENAQAFVRRFRFALERTTRARPFPIAVSFGVQDLADSSSPTEALEHAENAARGCSERIPARVQPKGGPSE